MLLTRHQIRQALAASGARTTPGRWGPSTADTLAAVAVAASHTAGCADTALVDGNRVGMFQIETDPADEGRNVFRDRAWLLRAPVNQCFAAIALTGMNGLGMWPQYRSGEYRRFLPDLFPPPIVRPPGEVPYQDCVLLGGASLRQTMKWCGWIAPSRADTNRVACANGYQGVDRVPSGVILRIPVQRGW